jgi:hypothetical protein
MTRVGRLRNVRASLAIAVALSLGLLGLGQIDGNPSSALPGTGMIEQGHKNDHPEPPGCTKAKQKYGKKPKKNCPSQQQP